MAHRPGKLVVISGPSGVGKTTILRLLLADLTHLIPSVSATTRPPRVGEQNGVDYHFIPAEEFERRRSAGDFLECCQVYGRQYWYGTLVDEVTPRLASGEWVVLEIDVEGTLSILARYPDAITIFVEPSHPDQLLERLRGRGMTTTSRPRSPRSSESCSTPACRNPQQSLASITPPTTAQATPQITARTPPQEPRHDRRPA